MNSKAFPIMYFIGFLLVNVNGLYQQSQEKLVGTGAVPGSSYPNPAQGNSVCVSGDGIFVGVCGYLDNDGAGSIWIYLRPDPSAYQWTQLGAKISPSSVKGFQFCTSCSFNHDGSVLAVSSSGGIYVFNRTTTGEFVQQGPAFLTTFNTFTVSISALTSDTIIASNPKYNNGGRAWIFRHNEVGWIQVNVFSSSNLDGNFGNSVSVSGDGRVIAVGQPGLPFTNTKYTGGTTGYVFIYTLNAASSYFQFAKMTSGCQGCCFGNSVSLTYDGLNLAVGSPYSTSSVNIYVRTEDGMIYIFSRSSLTNNFVQQNRFFGVNGLFGYIVLISANNLLSSFSAMEPSTVSMYNDTGGHYQTFGTYPYASLSISTNGDVLFIGSSSDQGNVGAAFPFNQSSFAVLPTGFCMRPADADLVKYSFSCPHPMPNNYVCIPNCASNYAALPEWISVKCMNGTRSSPLASCIPVPVLNSACPTSILAEIPQTIVVQGNGFLSSYNITCILDSGDIVAVFIAVIFSDSLIGCPVVWPNSTSNQLVHLHVALNSVFGDQIGLIVTILGSCDISKPGSVPTSSGCVCPAGTFDTGLSCFPCGSGEYQDQDGKANCIPCGFGQDTNGLVGSDSVTRCVCQVNYFPNPDYDTAKNSPSCLLCVRGMSCGGNNAVFIQPGFWRANNHTSAVLECSQGKKSCSGTISNSSNLCAVGYTGPICEACDAGYALSGSECVQCPATGLNYFILSLLVLFGLLMCYALVHTAAQVTSESDSSFDSESKKKNTEKVGIGIIFKVFINYMQVLHTIGRLSANWSQRSSEFFTVVGQSTLNPNFVALKCASSWSFYKSLLFMYFSPAIVVVSLAILYVIRHILLRKSVKESLNGWQLAVMVVLYQMHPAIMMEVLSSIPCKYVPGTGTSFLIADMTVDCASSRYLTYFAISILYLIFYTFGLVLALLYRGLYHNAISGKLFDQSASAHKKYAFFFIGYKPSCYYWEIVIMIRKLCITGLSASVNGGLQLVWSGIIIVVSLSFSLVLKPFASVFVNRLEIASLAALYLAVVIGFHQLLGGNKDWGLAFLILINGTMALVLFSCCVVNLRSKLMDWSNKYLPEEYKVRLDDMMENISTLYQKAQDRVRSSQQMQTMNFAN